MAKAGLIAGAHGLMIEVHHDPDKASSDGAQSLTIDQFKTAMQEIHDLINNFIIPHSPKAALIK